MGFGVQNVGSGIVITLTYLGRQDSVPVIAFMEIGSSDIVNVLRASCVCGGALVDAPA